MADVRLFDHQNLSLSDVKAVLKSVLPNAEVKNHSLLGGGMSTSNYRVDTPMGNVVLRLYPEENDHSQTEAMAYEKAKPFNIVPKIFGYDGSKRILSNSYMVMEYIEGDTLKDFVLKSASFPIDTAKALGAALGKLHTVAYDKWEELVPFREAIPALLNGRSGGYLRLSTKERAIKLLEKQTIPTRSVFSHGDFNWSNIIIASDKKPVFIDFEYSLLCPPYYDIGKFFRTKDEPIQAWITNETKAAFADGYNQSASETLPENWYLLAKLLDVESMLMMLNRNTIPDGWGEDVSDEIDATLDLVQENGTNIR